MARLLHSFMKNNTLSSFVGLCLLTAFSCVSYGQAPTTATDFNLIDCDGAEHPLFTELENGNVIVLEFEMGCTPCVTGRKALAKIQSQFESTHPGKLQVYTMGFSSTMKCATVQSWLTTNGITGPAFAGNTDVINAYNAQEGMPTIVVLGGTDHKILYWRGAFSNKDTVAIKAAISQVLTSASVKADKSSSIQVYPNPSISRTTIAVTSDKPDVVEVALYNAVGKRVLPIYNGALNKGTSELDFVTDKLANGTYYIHVTQAGKKEILPLTVTH
jgi:hypothetical protein